jgi:hypothetical protein
VASASGCTKLGSWTSDNVCIYVEGNGLFVRKATASFSAPMGWPCNTKLYITFFDNNNVKYDQQISSLEPRCVSSRTFAHSYNRTMRPGRACGAVSINGSMKPGACVSIHR